jgi:hypothetical protein
VITTVHVPVVPDTKVPAVAPPTVVPALHPEIVNFVPEAVILVNAPVDGVVAPTVPLNEPLVTSAFEAHSAFHSAADGRYPVGQFGEDCAKAREGKITQHAARSAPSQWLVWSPPLHQAEALFRMGGFLARALLG